ncbi:hypothetical protein IAD21_01319 [Abditibacteriota bacterium]|nr:hypothetical protein IAD21_01319 [Abditibacteriota bacterium]
MSVSRSSGKLTYPSGWPGVVIVALAAVLSILPLCMLAQALMKEPPSAFWPEFFADIPAAGISFLLVALAPLQLGLTRHWPWRVWGESLIRNRVWLIVAGFLLYAFIMKWATHGIVYTPDEYCAVLQARTLATLKLTPQVDPQLLKLVTPSWMQGQFISTSHADGRYSPNYWPGYALLMAPFAAVGAQWLYNAALSAMTFWLMWELGKRLTNTNEGGIWAVVMTICAAQPALQAATYFSMPAHLAFNLLFCWLLTHNTTRSTFLAGLVGSFALILHNPAPHFSFAFPWIVWIALRRRHQLLPLLAGYILIFLPVGIGWSAHLGSFDPDPYVIQAAVHGQDTGRFATVVSRILYVVRPPDIVLLLARIAGVVKWIVWAVPGTAGLALRGYLQLRADRKKARQEALPSEERIDSPSGNISSEEAHQYLWLLSASVVFNLVLYLFVRFDQGHGWGFRYIHQNWMAIPLLAAAFMVRQNGEWKRLGAILCLGGLFILLPLQIWQIRTYFDDIDAMGPPSPPSSPSITFIKERPRATTFILNDPFLRQPDWKLRSTSPEQNAKVAQHYLHNARRVQISKWSEIWIGDAFAHPGSSKAALK